VLFFFLECRIAADFCPTEEKPDMNLNVKSLRAMALATVIGTMTALGQPPAAPPAHNEMMRGKMAGMSAQRTKMMAMREKMMADMKANGAKMDLKVGAMNAAEGSAKTDAIAAVINEMTFQQKQMMANMDTMCNQMMENMAHPDAPMKHMEMGKPPAGSPR
jgi:hypothetical protein